MSFRRSILLAGGLAWMHAGCGADAPRSSPHSLAETMLAAAEDRYWATDFDSATALLRVGLEQARADGNEAVEAELLTWLGLAAWRAGDLAQARELGEAALRMKLQLESPRELWLSHNALAVLAYSEDRLPDMQRHAQAAVDAAQRAGSRQGEARAGLNLALASAQLGDFAAARAGGTAARDAARALGDIRLEANALANLALVGIWSGDAPGAIAVLDTARQLYRRIDYAVGEQNALGQLATAWQAMGEPARALAALDTALALARQFGMPEQEMEVLRLLGSTHQDLGDVPRALRYLEQAAAIARTTNLPGELANVLRTQAKGRLELGPIPLARALADSARQVHRSIGAALDELDDLLVQIEIEQAAGDAEAVARLREEARQLTRPLPGSVTELSLRLLDARLASRSGDARGVITALGDALPSLNSADAGTQAVASALLAHAWAQLGVDDSAAAAGFRAVAASERMRLGLPQTLDTHYAGSRADVYADLVLTLLRLGRIEEAFVVSDGARSRVLFEHIAMAANARHWPFRDADQALRRIDVLLEQRRRLERDALSERGSSADSDPGQLNGLIAEARADYEARLLRALQEAPQESRILGAGRATLNDVQRVLADDEVLLHYMLTRDSALLFVVTAESVRTLVLPNVASLLPRIRVLRDLWGRPNARWQDGDAFARALYQDLLEPALRVGIAAGSTLLIVPQGVLAQVPFAALQDARTQRYVVEDFAVVMLPSAATLPALRARTAAGATGRGALFAPFTRELPATSAELNAIRSMTASSSYRDGRATETALRRELRSAQFVHIASHGVMNAASPLFSRIELVGGRSRLEDDGRLEVHELLGLQIRSPLVFLSGCETNAAREWSPDPVRGAAYTTLAQAFLLAGARDVVATLWRVNDRGAAALASRFYEHLQSAGPAVALARAQRDVMRTGEFSSPYYWAGYAVHGSGARRRRRKNRGAHPLD